MKVIIILGQRARLVNQTYYCLIQRITRMISYGYTLHQIAVIQAPYQM